MTKSGNDHERPAGARVLYITYDGLTDPLGRSQILPYLVRLSARGHDITVLSCEKPKSWDRDGDKIRKLCAESKIKWIPLKYHKKPPVLSTVFDARALKTEAMQLSRRAPFDVIHCRSYIPAHVGLALKRQFGAYFVFDMRGFWPDEKLEGGHWNAANPIYAAVYKYFKRLESKLLQGADHIVSLTQAAKDQLKTRGVVSVDTPITVIPCCVDFDHFPLVTNDDRISAKRRLSLEPNASVLGYLGSLGGNYLLASMLRFFRSFAAHKENPYFLFVTQDEAGPIRQAANELGLDSNRLIILPASREEVPAYLAAADVGIAFKQPTFSAKACSPTKLGEMLATGLPVIANAGVGDVEEIISENDCGVLVSDFTDDSFSKALAEICAITLTAQERRSQIAPIFNIDLGVDRYDRIYREGARTRPWINGKTH